MILSVRRARNPLLIMGAVIAVMTTVFALWWLKINSTPLLIQPVPTALPSPNAYDQYLAAAKSLHDPEQLKYAVDDSVRPPLTPMPTTSGQPAKTLHRDPVDRPWSLSEKQALLRKNAASIKLLRMGFKHKYMYVAPSSQLDDVPLGANVLLQLSQLIVLDAQVKVMQGNCQAAARSYLEAIGFGISIPRGASLNIGFIGCPCRVRAERELLRIADQLSADDVRAAIQQLESFIAQSVQLSDLLRQEKLCGERTLIQVFNKPNWRGWVLSNSCDYPATRNSLELAVMLMNGDQSRVWSLMTNSKHDVLSEYTKTMDQWIRVVHQPYAARFPLPKEPINPFTQIMLGQRYNGIFFGDTKAKTLDALVLTALALRSYRLQQEEYPQQLNDLVPSYLSQVPKDPFALNVPLKYHRDGNHYLLYSIGPDGKDNGGCAIANHRWPDTLNDVEWDSKGDIVAGVNMQ